LNHGAFFRHVRYMDEDATIFFDRWCHDLLCISGQAGYAEVHRAYRSVLMTLMLSDQRRSRLRLAMDLLREPYYHWVVFCPQPSPRCSQRVRQSLRTSWP